VGNLTLTRKLEESIIIGGETKITVIGINKTQVRILIEAPNEIKILRDELLEEGDKFYESRQGINLHNPPKV
jgi:carbon storage regulator CsrA